MNISTPVTTVVCVGRIPTISTVSPDLHDALLRAARHHPSHDPKSRNVLDRHQEFFVDRTLRHRDVQLSTASISFTICSSLDDVTLDRLQRRAPESPGILSPGNS